MLSKFKDYISSNVLFAETDRILLAVSGGMDSAVLAELFHQAKLKFGIAHCNFCLRGDESDADEEFVKKLSKKYKVPFYCEKFDTKAYVDLHKVSVQMAARTLRYTWFASLLKSENFQYLATAHHRNDVLETVILNLVRGTGIAGMHGILPKNGSTIRPLLFAEKEDLRDYIAENQLVWREDSSNASNKYARNLVRIEVIPLLKTINENLEETIAQTVKKVGEVEQYFRKEVEALMQSCLKSESSADFLTVDLIKKRESIFLFEILQNYHFNYQQAMAIHSQLFDIKVGAKFISDTHTLVIDREQLVITTNDISKFISSKIEGTEGDFEVDGLKFTAKISTSNTYKIARSPKIAGFDKEKLVFPLKVRKWVEGDWFIPLGMNGKKKISDLLIDQKIPLNLKNEVKVITSGGSIIWVVGIRVDDRFKIRESTKEVYELRF